MPAKTAGEAPALQRRLRDGSKLVDGAEVMVVVLGHEEAEIDHGHRLSQPGMERGPAQLGRAHPGEPFHDPAAGGAEAGENVRDGAVVMGGFVRLAILKIGCVQFGSAGVVIIEPLVPERFEIKEMPGIFLDRPFAVSPANQDFGRQSTNGIGQAFRRAPEPLQEFGSSLGAEAELKPAVEPASLNRHSTNEPGGWD